MDQPIFELDVPVHDTSCEEVGHRIKHVVRHPHKLGKGPRRTLPVPLPSGKITKGSETTRQHDGQGAKVDDVGGEAGAEVARENVDESVQGRNNATVSEGWIHLQRILAAKEFKHPPDLLASVGSHGCLQSFIGS